MVQDSKPKFRRGLTAELAKYFLQKPDTIVTIDDLTLAFPNWTRHQIMHALATTANGKNPNANPTMQKVERLQRGMWRLVSGQKAPSEAPKGLDRYSGRDMTVEILKEKDTFLIVMDVVDEKIYKMTLVG